MASQVSTPETNTALLEREAALARVATAFTAGRTIGQLVGVFGEAGIGKTTLLQALQADTRSTRDWLCGYCEALDTPRPLGPLVDIAAELGGATAEALQAGAPRHEVFAAFLAALRDAPRPVVVCIEDVHWADDATLDLLQFLGRRLNQTKAVVLLTWRDDEVTVDHPLHRVLSAPPQAAVHRVRLEPLSVDAVRELAGPAQDAAAVHALTRGNPFFVTEIAAHPAGTVPESVRDAVLARRVRLEPEARAMLDLVAVVPARIELSLLASSAGPDLAGLEACVASGLLTVDGHTVAFRHELARRAIEDALLPPRARACHQRILDALVTRDDRERLLARLVHHADACGATAAVMEFGPGAASQAARVGAHRQALEHLRRVLRHADALPDATRVAHVEALAYEHYLTGDIDAARAARQDALAIWQRLGDREAIARNTRWLSRLTWFLGDGGEASRFATAAIEALRDLPETVEHAWVFSNRAQLDMLSDAFASCLDFGGRAIALARRLEAREVLCHALNNVGTARRMAGDSDGTAQQRESLEIALHDDLHEHAARAYTNLASIAVEERNYSEARRVLDAGIDYCTDRDLDSWWTYMTAWRARLRAETGLWQSACDDAEAVLGSPRPNAVSSVAALAVLAGVRVRRGDPGADVPLQRALDLARRTAEIQRLGPVLLVAAERAWLAGRHDEAARHAEEGLALTRDTHRPFLRSRLAFRLWRVRPDVTVDGVDGPDALAIAGRWQRAAAEWRRLGCPYEEAEALMGGDVEAVHAAHGIFHALGAAPAADWARQRLRQLGVSQMPRGRRASTLAHPAGLTARETEILTLLAQHLTNPQIGDRLFVSAKTVEHHVSSILGKLDVDCREAAAECARTRGWLGERRAVAN